MEITDETFEDALERRLHEALDPLSVTAPGSPRLAAPGHRHLLTATLAVVVLAALAGGSAAAAGGSNPVSWVRAATHSLGLAVQPAPAAKSVTTHQASGSQSISRSTAKPAREHHPDGDSSKSGTPSREGFPRKD